MVSSLKFFKSRRQFINYLIKEKGLSKKRANEIANKHWKGKGYYYHRGKGYWCRYSEKRDKKRTKKGHYPVGKGKWRHTFDPIIKRAVKIVKSVLKRKRKDPQALELAHYVWDNLNKKTRRKWTFIQVYNICKILSELARDKGIDVKSIDVLHGFDWRQGYKTVKAEALSKVLYSVAKEYDGITEKDVDLMLKDYYENLQRLSEYNNQDYEDYKLFHGEFL